MQDKAKSAGSKNLISGAKGDWEVIVGLEVHAQVASKSKLFSGASTAFGGDPNSHVSLVDAAMPGMLPVINAECIAQAVRTGLGLKAAINLRSVFDRKNYFYPDLPQGYQISQYKQPIVGEGEVEIDVDGETLHVGIERLHLEQDAGKSIHDQHPEYSYVDLNRSGVALMEIVSKPDMRSAKQAQAYVTKLRTILRYLGTSDADMEKGNLRADVNVSVRKPGDKLGTRCEIKNVNSIRFIGQAIEVEARRQIDIIEDGGKIDQETRLFDPGKGETRSHAEQGGGARLPLLPRSRPPAARADDGVRRRAGEGPAGAPRREEAALHARLRAVRLRCRRARRRARVRPTTSRPWPWAATASSPPTGSSTSCSGASTRRGSRSSASPVSAKQLGSIVDLIASGTISGKIAKDLFEIVWTEGGDPAAIVEKRGHEAGHRHRRHREGGRRDHRGQSRQGGAGEGQAVDARLVRRAGDEGLGRQGQPAGRQRDPEAEARGLSRRSSSVLR